MPNEISQETAREMFNVLCTWELYVKERLNDQQDLNYRIHLFSTGAAVTLPLIIKARGELNGK